MQDVINSIDVERILSRTVSIANSAITNGSLAYLDGSSNEKGLFSLIQHACELEGFKRDAAELVSGHKFPDVVFEQAQIGVEIKGHKQGDRILGNSIMGSTPSLLNPSAIYLLAWNDANLEVVWRDYFECVVGAEVTHSPRFVLKPTCTAEERLFGNGENQIGEADEICLGPDGFKSDVILAKMRTRALASGNIPWWISDAKEDQDIHSAIDAQSQLSIVKYSSLDAATDRPSLLKALLIGFPELFGKSRTKYDAALVWSLLRKSVLISRDAFSAGGQIEMSIPSICKSNHLRLPKIFDSARNLFDSPATVSIHDIEDIWLTPNLTGEKLLLQLKIRIVDSGISAYRDLVLHQNCECSNLTREQFADCITDWLLENLKTTSFT